MEFFETLVRIHREGAPFTGIKPAGTPLEPGVAKADAAIASGSADSLIAGKTESAAQEIRERFNGVMETKQHMNESVEAGREYVDAYVEFVHYVENNAAVLRDMLSLGGMKNMPVYMIVEAKEIVNKKGYGESIQKVPQY